MLGISTVLVGMGRARKGLSERDAPYGWGGNLSR